ncbi:MAG TPA: glycosyltransferase family 4 protein [Acidimicrobiales bacterium]|nr:glycosyltransferase family 4 protein [Acidimicrobiales bacterium]
MRIVHVSDCYLPRLGGIELQVHDLACRQAAAGHEVAILTTTAAGGAPAHLGNAVEVVRAASDRRTPEKIVYRSTRRGTAALLSRLEEFDAVHVHASSFSPLAFLAAHHASGRGVPSVATVHSLWAKATPLFRAADWLTGWGDWQVVWSAVSNAAAASLRSIVGGKAPVTIVPNGVDPEEWRVAPAPPRADALRVAAVSRLARRKRLLQLVEMLHAAHDQLPEGLSLDVRILGEGPQRKDIERYLRRHDMEAWVHLLGRRSRAEIRSVFAESDLFMAPASLESFGIAALEARCAGLPVVALAGTGVQDFVAHGREGWLVRSDAAMVETIVSLARSPEVVAHVAAHNRSVPASISWHGVLAQCEDLYGQASVMHGRRWTPAPPVRPAQRRAAPGPSQRDSAQGRLADEQARVVFDR